MPIVTASAVSVCSPVIHWVKSQAALVSSLRIGHLAVLHCGFVHSLEVLQEKALFLKMTEEM